MIVINFIIQAIKIIFLLGILVTIHEAGHFLSAKLFKVPVKEFAIGFGKILFSKEKNGTKYSIRLFPLGGFVNIEEDDENGIFAKLPLYKKNIILLAGSFVNFIFAIIVGFIVLFGMGDFISNEIQSVNEKSDLVNYQINSGDKIYSINDRKIYTKNQIDSIMRKNSGENLNIEIKSGNDIRKINLKPLEIKYPSLGVTFEQGNKYIYISNIGKEQSDIHVNDIVTKVDGNSYEDIKLLYEYIYNNIGKTLKFEIKSGDTLITKDIKVDSYSKYVVGIQLKPIENTISNKLYYSSIEISNFVYETVNGTIELFSGKNNGAELMGIIGVSDIVVKTSDAYEYFGIMASVSLSLSIVNMLPLPILDGGKIVLFTIERYTKKKINEKVVTAMVSVTVIALIALTVYVMYADIVRII